MEQRELRRAAIAAEIRGEAARQNIDTQSLADGSDIKIATLRLRLKGRRPFTVDELDRLAHFLNLPLVTLIERAEVNNA